MLRLRYAESLVTSTKYHTLPLREVYQDQVSTGEQSPLKGDHIRVYLWGTNPYTTTRSSSLALTLFSLGVLSARYRHVPDYPYMRAMSHCQQHVLSHI